MFGDSFMIWSAARRRFGCQTMSLQRRRLKSKAASSLRTPKGSPVECKFTAVQQNPQDAAVTFPLPVPGARLAPGQVVRHQFDLFRRRAARQDREIERGDRLGAARPSELSQNGNGQTTA